MLPPSLEISIRPLDSIVEIELLGDWFRFIILTLFCNLAPNKFVIFLLVHFFVFVTFLPARFFVGPVTFLVCRYVPIPYLTSTP